MNKENSLKLVTEFPNLYRDYGGDPRNTCMAFGFEVGDGWFDILWNLSEILEPMGVIASQVKEKYGTLRFYIYGGTDEAYDLIDDAEELSEHICELCGKPGKINKRGWLSVRCADCRND